MLRNLGANAARHAATSVALGVDDTSDTAEVTVDDDDGPGIPESERERVLERFARLDEAALGTKEAAASGWPSSPSSSQPTPAPSQSPTVPSAAARFTVRLPAQPD